MIKKGLLLANKYLVESKINDGGTGCIYKAYYEKQNTYVAIKFIANKSNYKDIDNNEVNILKTLHHEMLPKVYELITYGEDTFIVMDYIKGLNLTSYMELNTVKESKVIEIAYKLISVICYLHSRGIVHCDIKPSNIIINNKDLYLVDFGISIKNNKGRPIGKTKFFASPEQTAGEVVDFRTDLFSYGATLYYILTGKYLDISFEQTLNKKVSSKKLQKIIVKCLQVNPSKRYLLSTQVFRSIKKLYITKDITYRKISKTVLGKTLTSILILLILSGFSDLYKLQSVKYNSFVEKANENINCQNYYEASLQLEQAIKINKFSFKTQYLLCQTYLNSNKYDLCLKQVNYLLKRKMLLSSNHLSKLYNTKIKILVTHKNYKELYEVYKEIAKIDRDNPLVYYQLAITAKELKMNNRISKYLYESLALLKQNNLNNLLTSQVYIELEEFTQAIKILEELQKTNKDIDKVEKYLLLCYKQDINYINKEINLLTKLNTDSDANDYCLSLAYSYYKLSCINESHKNLSKSLKYYNKALANDINNIAIYDNIFLVYTKLNMLKDAENILSIMKKKFPDKYLVCKRKFNLNLKKALIYNENDNLLNSIEGSYIYLKNNYYNDIKNDYEMISMINTYHQLLKKRSD